MIWDLFMKKFFSTASSIINPKNGQQELKTLEKKLLKQLRFETGHAKIWGWDLEYVDGPALISCLDVLVIKEWNGFLSTKNNPVIFDCGSNIGISVLYYKSKYPNAKITAFEPDPNIIQVLRRNIIKNKVDDVMVIDAAVWTKNGEAQFFCEGADGSRLTPASVPGTVTVKTVSLNDLIIGEIDLLKLDIEGAEYDVILSIAQKLNLIKNIVIEYHLNYDNISQFAESLMLLSSANFEMTLNTYGPWRDLIHHHPKLDLEFDQYILVTGRKREYCGE